MHRRDVRRVMVLVLVLAASTAACGERGPERTAEAAGEVDPSWSPQQLTEVRGVPAAQIRQAVAARLEGKPLAPLTDEEWTHARRLYKAYGNGPLWLAPDGLHEKRAAALTGAILDGHKDALRMNAYPVGELARALAALDENDRPTAQQLAEADLLLSATYVAIAEDLMTGQVDPKTVSQSWFIDPQEERVDSALVRALRETKLDSAIARMRPQEEDYAALQKELLRLRELVSKGGWPKVPAGRPLKPGESDSPARLQALRVRLAAEGLLASGPQLPASDSTRSAGSPKPEAVSRAPRAVYDRTLAGAVATFQSRHGIPVDSLLGEETVRSLNVPATYRLGQVAANLERYRWLPRSLGSRYLLVNVPAFRVEGYDDGRKAIEMKVIVGQEYEDRATPVFSDSMEVVVFRPYWFVTPDIQAKEMEPKIAADPGYMARGNYEYYQEGGQTRIRQRPGDENSLGLVKFLFPNDYNIYLHDTPDDKLFEKDVRAFSHGCIRLEKPEEMAQWVLGWDAQKVQDAMHSSQDNRTVKLPRKLPVYIAYFTAYLRDGQLHFGNDLYDRDGKLVAIVNEGAYPTTQAVQAVEALQRIAER
ncbi:MAG TPA: L,D-transpeptidase family protein [Gemmatimonadaceae bacterium]|nr:L,D-transpeptidase family protein [Gemmatimonadaceae bacterium]